ncbi:MAG: BlaI/MecI/CopY family transcriptional regulator [Deltaproteobacteria bacterium]|nr:BlaI/MecI/CopY family transcriptional regulator [Deltaproteobacteria bacterium]
MPVLGALEEAVLDHLWRVGEADVQETHQAVGAARKISVNTVGSALERLHKKELVGRQKVSHAYRYHATIAEAELRAARVLAAVGGIRGLSREGILAAFVDLVGESDDNALDNLEMLIADRRAQGGKRKA